MANKYKGDVTKDGVAVKMYDSKGNALSDGYSVNGTTYKSDGSRIDVGTTVAGNDGKMYTYNGEGKETTVHTPEPVKSGSSSKSSGGSSTSNSSDYNSLVNSLANAQKAQQKANLKKALANTLSSIASQEEATKTNTKNAKNNAEAQKMLNDKRMANTFANLGLTNSGTNAQSIINSNGALQNVLGGLDANNQTALNELARQRALAQGNYESDLANAYAGIDANALSNQLNYLAQMNQMQQQLANQKELAQLDLEYNNVWDNTLGRYVPFSYYQASHGIGKTGGSGTSSNPYDEQIMKSYLTYYNSVLSAGGDAVPMSYNDYYNAIFGTKPTDSKDLSNEDKTQLVIDSYTGKQQHGGGGMTDTVKPSLKNLISNMFK